MTRKELALRVLDRLGLFALAKLLTRRALRVVCYHGFVLEDEHRFRPGMFIRHETFRRRLERLSSGPYTVLPIDRVPDGAWPDRSVVITIDDGWSGTMLAAEELSRKGLPATLYVSSYYAERGTQVFNVLSDYLFWKTQVREFELPEFGLQWKRGQGDTEQLKARIKEVGDALAGVDRQRLAEQLAQALGVEAEGLFRYVSLDELGSLGAMGVDVQLHTHRHRFGTLSLDEVRKEIADNRRALEPVASSPLVHFCYPSGNIREDQVAVLREVGIRTATTCVNELNFPGADPLRLGRFLDGDDVPDIVFEAELCGLLPLLRKPSLIFRCLIGR